MWQIYCALCGNPTNSDAEGTGPEHKWMNRNRVLNPEPETYSSVGKYNMYGDVVIDGDTQGYAFTENPTVYGNVLVHDACWRVCNYPMVFTSTAPADLADYQGQFFEGFDVDPEAGLLERWMLLDPLTNQQNRNRIVSKLHATKFVQGPQFHEPTVVKVVQGPQGPQIVPFDPTTAIPTKRFIVSINGNGVKEITIRPVTTIGNVKKFVRDFVMKTYGRKVGNVDIYLNREALLNVGPEYDHRTLEFNWDQIDTGFLVPHIL